MSTLRSILGLVTAGAVGAVTAAAITMLLAPPSKPSESSESPRAAPKQGRSSSGARPKADRTGGSTSDTRLVRLEREVHGLRAQLDDGGPSEAPTARDASPLPLDGLPPDEEETVERTRQVWDAQVEAHEDAPVDPQWSNEARASFERGLTDAAGELGGDVRVDCRTDSCLATVEFDSYGSATTSFSGLLEHDYDLNCETSVAMPPPEDPNAPYGAEILFVCPDGGRG